MYNNSRVQIVNNNKVSNVHQWKWSIHKSIDFYNDEYSVQEPSLEVTYKVINSTETIAVMMIWLLGPEKASDIVNPSILEKPISPPVQRLLVARTVRGAEELWKALHEEPKLRRQLAEAKKGNLLSYQVPWLGRPVSTYRMQQVDHWRRQLHTMYRLGKQHQRTASCLLATKHITDLSDPNGTEGPTRYLHFTLNTAGQLP
uniref:Uncharacterized protein n=1 Tax=Sphaerodactylus townsendi TaxID=933632 RepID=A0ACB8EGT8_9SAUR